MKFFALFGLLVLQSSAKSQLVSSSVTNSAGSSYSQGAYSFDWSVGELAIVETMKAESSLLVLTNGFLQPNLPANAPVQSFSDAELKISPNPTYARMDLKFATIHRGLFTISLYDTRGKLLYTGKKFCNGVPDIERIDLSSFAAGTYVVRVHLDPEKGSMPKSGSYKIIKL
jgi:hypothetical protein